MLAIRVQKEDGQLLLQLLEKDGLLDRRRIIKKSNSHLVIPINPITKALQKTFLLRFKNSQIINQPNTGNVWKKPSFNTLLLKELKNSTPPDLWVFFPRKIRFLGDIAIVNLSKKLDVIKHEIGNVILSNYEVKSVVNQKGPICSQFRIPNIEVIAGENSTETTHVEKKCYFKMDLSKTMFCKSNFKEKNRLIRLIKKQNIVIDMFAGLGQFSVPIGVYSHPKRIYSFELNPITQEYLKENIRLNGLEKRVYPIFDDSINVNKYNFEKTVDHVIINMPLSVPSKPFLEEGIKVLSENGLLHYSDVLEDRNGSNIVLERVKQAAKKSGKTIGKILHSKRMKQISPNFFQYSTSLEIKKEGR